MSKEEATNGLDHTNHSNNTFNAYCMCGELRRSSDYAITQTMQFRLHRLTITIIKLKISANLVMFGFHYKSLTVESQCKLSFTKIGFYCPILH